MEGCDPTPQPPLPQGGGGARRHRSRRRTSGHASGSPSPKGRGAGVWRAALPPLLPPSRQELSALIQRVRPMRPLLVLLPLLALASWATAAAPPATMRSADQLDYLFLGSDRPVLLRLHVRVGDKALRGGLGRVHGQAVRLVRQGQRRLPLPGRGRPPAEPSASRDHPGAFGRDASDRALRRHRHGQGRQGLEGGVPRLLPQRRLLRVPFPVQNYQADQAKQVNEDPQAPRPQGRRQV